MPLFFKKGDITKLKVDAIVNAANSSLLGGGGVDGCIHRAAGPELLVECRTLNGCATGDAKITKGYNLPAKHVIHTVGPIWHGGKCGEKEALTSCYKRSLEVAKENNCKTVAFPLISAGAYGYPKDDAKSIAIDTIGRFLAKLGEKDPEMTVYLVLYDSPFLDENTRNRRILKELSFVLNPKFRFDDFPAFKEEVNASYNKCFEKFEELEKPKKIQPQKIACQKLKESAFDNVCCDYCIESYDSLDDYLNDHKAESFSNMLQRLISEKNITNAKCYAKANVSRQLFSKIISNENYQPKKPVALAFAIALKLNIKETENLLKSAGLALTNSKRFDVIVSYFIEKRSYDINFINECLCDSGETLLGSGVM